MFIIRRSNRVVRSKLIGVLSVAAVVGSLAVAAAGASASDATAGVQVQLNQPLAQLGKGALGTVIWNPNAHSGDREVPRLLRDAGIGALSYEAGPAVDLYDWQTNTLKPDPNPNPGHVSGDGNGSTVSPYNESLRPAVSFDRFGQMVRQTGAEALAYVNYGTGTPEEAAGFVHHANVVRHYGIRYWEIGQNAFLNGCCIPGLELGVDGHADRSPEAFATNALQFLRAMKAADRSIKVGITLFGSNALPFNDKVLRVLAPYLDFVDLQVYPGRHLSDADLLRSPQAQAGRFAAIRQTIAKYTDRKVELLVGETNSSVEPGAQQVGMVNALFLPDHMLTMYENGVSHAFWFAFELGLFDTPPDIPAPWTPNAASIFGYGDYGLMSSGQCDTDTNVCQPAAHTPFPAYFGMQMVSALTAPGAQLLVAASGDALVRAHAARLGRHELVVLLINQDPQDPRSVTIDVPGAKLGPVAEVETYGIGSPRPRRRHALLGRTPAFTLAPYSITTLTFHIAA
jgi:alpha-L-arabinofuranosidase